MLLGEFGIGSTYYPLIDIFELLKKIIMELYESCVEIHLSCIWYVIQSVVVGNKCLVKLVVPKVL